MKTQFIRIVALIAFLANLTWPVAARQTAPPGAETRTGTWRIDPARSEVRFTITKLGFEDVTGVFRQSEGTVRYDPVNPAGSSIQWRVRVASVLTDASNRDSSLQAPEYFDARRHPDLSFVSRAVRARDAQSFDVDGEITIRGVTRPLTVVVRSRAAADRMTFETEFEINRYDFGITGGSVMGRLIGSMARVRLVAVTVPMPAATRAR